ncbi:MAG TPA: NAD(P)-dependent oxidoreductase [Actinocrinis sp.]
MTETVTVLGTGIMGSGIARSLAREGFEVRAWNRTPQKAEPLKEAGIAVVPAAAEAVSGADIVLTMLFDADAVAQVMERALPRMGGAVWVQSSTIGPEATERFAQMAEGRGIAYVDAPMLGTKQPAEKGELIVIGSGQTALRTRLAPVFGAVGARTVWAGPRPGDGQRLKLAANAWVLSLVGAAAQSVRLTADLGLDPQLFLEAVSGGPLDCGYLQVKADAMITGDFEPAFPLDGAVKDGGLILEAMRAAGVDDQLMRALAAGFERASHSGHGAQDMAAVVTAFQR